LSARPLRGSGGIVVPVFNRFASDKDR